MLSPLWLIDYYNTTCRYRLRLLDASALIVHLELVLLLLLHRSRIGSRPAARDSKDGCRSYFLVCFRPYSDPALTLDDYVMY